MGKWSGCGGSPLVSEEKEGSVELEKGPNVVSEGRKGKWKGER